MHTVFTTNNGYDSILLVNGNDRVVSAWQADNETVSNYLQDGAKAEGWHENEWSSFADPSATENEEELRTIVAYGEEVGRDGQIIDDRCREFWIRD